MTPKPPQPTLRLRSDIIDLWSLQRSFYWPQALPLMDGTLPIGQAA